MELNRRVVLVKSIHQARNDLMKAGVRQSFARVAKKEVVE